jgi:REP element-mobilizing transposase RayT
MPRRPRIETTGYYHIVNRGVERRTVFKNDEDYTMFTTLLCQACEHFDVHLHSYCLMPNHYHLLIETKTENLSQFMRQVNGHYAIYFNRKYKRSGHLWQGRFKSWYVTDENYLYTLIRYIEQNPIKAKITKEIGVYRYSASYLFLQQKQEQCLKNSFIVTAYKEVSERKEFLEGLVDDTILEKVKKASSLVEAPLSKTVDHTKTLETMFKDYQTKKERNSIIVQAYKDGYSQHAIAKFLELSQPTVSAIIKSFTTT